MARAEGRKPSRFPFYSILVLIVVLIGGYIAYYVYVHNETKRYVDEWLADMERDGYEVTYSERTFSGFPFLIKAEFTDPKIVDTLEDMSWEGERVWLALRPWNFYTYLGNAPGKNEIRLADGERYTVELGRNSRLSYGTKMDGTPNRIGLKLDEALVRNGSRAGAITGFVANLGITPDDENDIRLAVDWTGITLPAEVPDAEFLGRDIGQGAVRLLLNDAVPAFDADDPVRAWLENGGGLNLAMLDVVFGPVDLEANAELSFDARGRMQGPVNIRLLNLPELAKALRGAGIDPSGGGIDIEAAGEELPLSFTFREGDVYLFGQKQADTDISLYDF